MSRLLKIMGRGLEVETSDLIWQWLGQVAESRHKTDPRHAQELRQIIESGFDRKSIVLQQKLDEYRAHFPRCYYADLAAAASAWMKDVSMMLYRCSNPYIHAAREM